jgi:hypothetical protein
MYVINPAARKLSAILPLSLAIDEFTQVRPSHPLTYFGDTAGH